MGTAAHETDSDDAVAMMSQLDRYAPLISLIGKTRPRRILEVGPGPQGLGRFLARRFVGADRDFSDYTGSARRPSPWMLPVRAEGSRLPFAAGTFDLVVVLDVLEHVPPCARPGILAECDQVARGRIAIGFPCGELAEAHDRELFRWLSTRGLPVPGWLQEHLAAPIPTVEVVQALFSAAAARIRIVEDAWLPLHRVLMRWEAVEPYTRYSAALSDLLAPTDWDWVGHRGITNLLWLLIGPLWPLLRTLDRRPGYRKLVIIEKEAAE